MLYFFVECVYTTLLLLLLSVFTLQISVKHIAPHISISNRGILKSIKKKKISQTSISSIFELLSLYCKVKMEPHVCQFVLTFKVLVLLTVYKPHSFCITVFTGHDYSALSHTRFTVTMSYHNVLIWWFTEGEDYAQVVMSGCIIQSGYCLFNCGASALPNFCPARSQPST